MVDRYADDRKADRNIDAGHCIPLLLFPVIDEAFQLCRDMALIMIHDNRHIIPAACQFREDRIRRYRRLLRNIDPFGNCFVDRRLDLIDLLAAEQTSFAAVRVQTRDTDLRFFDPDPPALGIRHPDHVEYPGLLHAVAGFPKRNMRRYMNDTEIFMRKHHRIFSRICKVRVDLRMAVIVVSGCVHPRLVQCIRDRCIDLVRHRKFDDLLHILKRCVSAHDIGFFDQRLRSVSESFGQRCLVFCIDPFRKVHKAHVIDIDRAIFEKRILDAFHSVDSQFFRAFHD